VLRRDQHGKKRLFQSESWCRYGWRSAWFISGFWLRNLWITLHGARFSRKSRRSCVATRVTVAVATAEWHSRRDGPYPAKPIWDGPLRVIRRVLTR